MTASVDIITQRKEDVLAVPLSSVTTRPKDSADSTANTSSLTEDDATDEVVFRRKADNTVEKVVVISGISDYENIEIISGLSKGDEVVSGPYVAVFERVGRRQDGGRS